MAPSVPDRWTAYKACGSVIQGTRIICFKVPLKRVVQKNLPGLNEIWDVKALIEAIPKLRAVVDLTNTTRYYNPEELKLAGVLHKKIFMPGRIIPPKQDVKQFMNEVDAFLRLDADSLVGVHCTHGLNRTGYMVCRYMRDRLGIPAQEAITRFEEARGYSIERKNYVAHILGKKPAAPDFGKNTVVKPLINKTAVQYRSPLSNNYDELDDSQPNAERNRFGRNNVNNGECSRYKQGKPSMSRRERKASREYDYKHDY